MHRDVRPNPRLGPGRTRDGRPRRAGRAALGALAVIGLSGTAFVSATDTAIGHPGAAPQQGTTLAAAGGPHLRSGQAGEGLARPIVGAASTATGQGYWLAGSDGGIFSFGDARFLGSTGAIRLNQPIVGMAATPSGNGYWLVAADGGIFTFGDAPFFGSTGNLALSRPIVGMAATRRGTGYWFVAGDGGVFSFGDARFAGSAIATGVPIVSMAPSGGDHGYWLAGQDGSVFSFGDAANLGSGAGLVGEPVVGVAAAPTGGALWLAGQGGTTFALPSKATAAVAGSSSFSWLATNADGSPIRWDPCHPIHVVTNLAGAPASAADDVSGALSRISSVTGIDFVNDGSTDEVPANGRPAVQPNRYGNGWVPVLIAWSTPQASSLLPGGGTLGEGGSSWVSVGGANVYVTGIVAIDAGATSSLSPGYGGGTTEGDLLLHELGHVIGLGHTPDRSQVMYADLLARSSSGYGSGDLAGLRRLGTDAGCFSTPAP